MEVAVLEYILALVLSGASSPWTDTDATPHIRTLQLDVDGPASTACNGLHLDVPVGEGGVIYFANGGLQYEGVEAPNGMIVLRSIEAEHPLSLSGDERTGGRWSRGDDGSCTGAWHVVP
jgi:hypothetical protein